MIGIDSEKMSLIIKKNNYYADCLLEEINNMLEETEKISLSCNGKLSNLIDNNLYDYCKEIKKIISIIYNYSTILEKSVESYKIKAQQITQLIQDRNQ